MNIPRYCVYNQTNECFLSLGIALGERAFAPLKAIFKKGRLRTYEGRWITLPGRGRTIGLFSSRDVIYLDAAQKVVHVVECLPALKTAPVHKDATSVLILPVSAIQSSQTQVGNQLLICVAEEMEIRLRSSQNATAEMATGSEIAATRSFTGKQVKERRIAPRTRWPRLVAFDSEGGAIDLHGIRDISTTGLYLMTSERWPVGSQVRMSLQRSDGLDDSSMIPITIDLRVSRWGDDGVGLEFLRADAEHSVLVAMHVR